MRCWLPAVTVFFIFHQNADFSGKSFIIAFVRGGAGVVERDRLLSGYWDKTQSGVRIPPSPLKTAFHLAVFYFEKSQHSSAGTHLIPNP